MRLTHEPSLWRAITTGEPYPVKALIVQCHNAVGSSADARAAEAALRSENLALLVVHDMFLNKTSALADYLLPAAHWLEKPFYSAGYGYAGFSGDHAEAKPAPIAATQRSDYDLWRDLGWRLGQHDEWPATAEEFWDSLVRPAGLRYELLCGHLGPRTGNAARSHDQVDDESPKVYGTASGKVELRSTLLAKWGLDPLPSFEPPARGGYPLLLITGGRALKAFHQDAQLAPWFRAEHQDPIARLHPATAAEAGVQTGDWISIATEVGTVRQKAETTEALRPGVIHADRWWYPERADDEADPFGFWATNVNVCTDSALTACDPVMGSWPLRAVPCRISDESSRWRPRLWGNACGRSSA